MNNTGRLPTEQYAAGETLDPHIDTIHLPQHPQPTP